MNWKTFCNWKTFYRAMLWIAIILLIFSVVQYSRCGLSMVNYLKKNHCICPGENPVSAKSLEEILKQMNFTWGE